MTSTINDSVFDPGEIYFTVIQGKSFNCQFSDHSFMSIFIENTLTYLINKSLSNGNSQCIRFSTEKKTKKNNFRAAANSLKLTKYQQPDLKFGSFWKFKGNK